ncbi:ribonuclease activity regulator RraA [Muricauda sp. 2012CJ35-5]|uniref:Ribonuclease activity regulator RraA n=1 Tax=Flagellimonas spongiicola TaxID=2942208 RepID=A0ABT0PTD0_9FLAO|nr:ribonuclease activity regulator RraA [Allomuricauda spongiicola]MCL6273718.1 ribonuclease activity regulator RraA [Allomuricauda spongiicola]
MKESTEIEVLLKNTNTASIATCLFKLGLKHQFIQNVRPINYKGTPMVGRAYTLRYIPAREDLNPIEVFKDPKHLQRLAIEQCPKGHVLVIDSRRDARAASAGSILVTRLLQRGVEGIVTDGGFRDTQEIGNLDIHAFHTRPSAPTNLTLHHAIALNEPIACGEVAVFPGDYIVGDLDGVMVIPSNLANRVAQECKQMAIYEEFVVKELKKGSKVQGLYPLTDNELIQTFEKWKSELPK